MKEPDVPVRPMISHQFVVTVCASHASQAQSFQPPQLMLIRAADDPVDT